MSKEVVFDKEARERMFAGAEKVAKAVMSTLGPCGRLVAVEKDFGGPVLTKDGVTVAKEIDLEDKLEKIGGDIIRETSIKANDRVGDGTTTATTLAYAMLKEGKESVDAGMSPIDIKRGIELGVNRVCKELKKISKAVKTDEEVKNVATISANNDPEIGNIVAEAIEKVGKDGVITVEEGKTLDTTVKVTDGLEFDRGYINPYFTTDKAHLRCEYDDSLILITDQKITSLKSIINILDSVVNAQKPLYIIADDVDGEALTGLILNRIRSNLNVCAVKAPGFGERKKEMIRDIAIATGAKVISSDEGLTLENATIEHLGRAKKIKSTKDNTVIINGYGKPEDVDARITQIKTQIEEIDSEYEKEQLQKRLAKLTSGVAVISVGALTETDLREKKYRVEDTLAAARAALDEGIVPGGGTSLIMAKKAILKDPEIIADPLLQKGYDIVIKAIEEPTKMIAENSGVNGVEIVTKSLEQKTGVGYDARRREWVNMIDSGIIDPTKVELEAIRDAGSIAGMLLSTNCAITIIPEKNNCNCGNAGM